MDSERKQEIEVFLENLKQIAKQSEKTTAEDCYNLLCDYQIDEEELQEQKKDPEGVIKRKKQYLDYIAQEYPWKLQHMMKHTDYFLHIKNCSVSNGSNCYKIYISVGNNNLENVTQQLYNYIVQERIKMTSKISYQNRSDTVVIRVIEKEDTKKVLNFINSNLSEELRKTNPFIPRDNIAAIACDRDLSYNKILAILLSMFVDRKKVENKLDEISLENFKKFIIELNENIINNTSILNIISTKDSIISRVKSINYNTDEEIILNIKEIIEYLLLSLDETKNKDNYLEEIDKNTKKDIKNILLSEDIKLKTNDKPLQKDLLDNYIMYIIQKNSIESICNILEKCINDNNYNNITEENGFKFYFMQYLPIEELKQITNGNIKNYINKLINENTSEFDNKTIIEICLKIYNDEGEVGLMTLLKSVLTDDYSLIPEEYLEKIEQIDKKQLTRKIIELTKKCDTNNLIDDEMKDILDKKTKRKYPVIFEEMCNETAELHNDDPTYLIKAFKKLINDEFDLFPEEYHENLEYWSTSAIIEYIKEYIKEYYEILGYNQYSPEIEEIIFNSQQKK